MTTAGLLYPWITRDGVALEISYALTREGVEVLSARNGAGVDVEMDRDEHEAFTHRIEAERADDILDARAERTLRKVAV